MHGNFNPIRNIFRVAGQAASGKRGTTAQNSWSPTGRNCAKRRMLRVVCTALRGIAVRATSANATSAVISNPVSSYTQRRTFRALSAIVQKWVTIGQPAYHKTLLNHATTENCLVPPVGLVNVPARTVTKFSLTKGKRKTVRAVTDRFYRLNWGIWIRTKAGRRKHLWRKSSARKKRLREHVFCNATQSTLLDKMVSKYWRRRHYYVDDPYEPYHEREEFMLTRKKPLS